MDTVLTLQHAAAIEGGHDIASWLKEELVLGEMRLRGSRRKLVAQIDLLAVGSCIRLIVLTQVTLRVIDANLRRRLLVIVTIGWVLLTWLIAQDGD